MNEIKYVPKGTVKDNRPSLKRLAELNGEPPWVLHVPDTEFLPQEVTDLVGALEWRGVTFERKDDRDG